MLAPRSQRARFTGIFRILQFMAGISGASSHEFLLRCLGFSTELAGGILYDGLPHLTVIALKFSGWLGILPDSYTGIAAAS